MKVTSASLHLGSDFVQSIKACPTSGPPSWVPNQQRPNRTICHPPPHFSCSTHLQASAAAVTFLLQTSRTFYYEVLLLLLFILSYCYLLLIITSSYNLLFPRPVNTDRKNRLAVTQNFGFFVVNLWEQNSPLHPLRVERSGSFPQSAVNGDPGPRVASV